MPNQTLAIVGECMLELCHSTQNLFEMKFAGDAYNVAYYFQSESRGKNNIEFISALGTDVYSDAMIKTWSEKGIGVSHVRNIEQRMPGLYFVETDNLGERTFHYYRSQAAARDMFEGEGGDQLLADMSVFTHLYFSGITLAILNPESREKFLAKLSEFKQQGMIIAFDTNYRPKLWDTPAVARACMNAVLPFVDIGLPSLTDMMALYETDDRDVCFEHYFSAGVSKIIASCGEDGYMIATKDACREYPVEVVRAIDTTAAGDSFNGAYLAAIMQGDDDETACKKAAALSAKVVQCRGALV